MYNNIIIHARQLSWSWRDGNAKIENNCRVSLSEERGDRAQEEKEKYFSNDVGFKGEKSFQDPWFLHLEFPNRPKRECWSLAGAQEQEKKITRASLLLRYPWLIEYYFFYGSTNYQALLKVFHSLLNLKPITLIIINSEN